MKQLIEYIVSNLVNHPEDVVIEESTSEDNTITIIISVNPEDVGRVIGRAGKVIKAIRQIARIAAIQKGLRVNVDLKQDLSAPPRKTTEESTPSKEPILSEESTPSEKSTPTEEPAPTLE